MTTVLLVAAASLFRFSGGGDQALVDQTALQLKRPIVMLAVGTEPRKPFEFPYESGELRRLLRVKTGLEVTPDGGLFPTAWPAGVDLVWEEDAYQRLFSTFIPRSRFKDGRMTLRTPEREAASLGAIANLGLSRPLVWPRFYDRVRLRLNVTNVTEKAFLTAVAEATGTRLIEEPSGYRLTTDPKQYRARALALWRKIGGEAQSHRDPVGAADADYMVALLTFTKDWLLAKGIDDPEGDYAQSWRPGTPVHTAAWRRATARFNTNSAEVRDLFPRVARSSDPVYGYIRDTGMPKVGYRNAESHEVVEL